MQLDRTRIVIRERGMLEVYDLALRVIRYYPLPLLATTAAGAIPFALLNWLCLGWMLGYEYEGWGVARYLWAMSLLVFLEAPAASLLTTLYLGDVVFLQRPRLSAMLGELARQLLPLTLSVLLLRGVAPAVGLAALTWILRYEDVYFDVVFLPMLAGGVCLIRALRPFIGEIILLERNPLRSRTPGTITIGRRSAALHNPSAGELMGQWITAAAIGIPLTLAVLSLLWFLQGTFLRDWGWGHAMLVVGVPLAMWIVVGYFSVVRMLSYLDLRIRREGWEVELRLRAEAARLARQIG